ncbi:hypothetical protein ACFWZ2_41895 [Streptomyces sp. NPDC059002]|uniref:hypothetical protein n=1 Tax=Streptomyces sp. NPDC059002 TaxID=3346690 RepID=UPI00369E7563
MRDQSSLSHPQCPCKSGTSGRFGPTHTLILLIVFLILGCGLFLVGTPLSSTFALLGGCGAIGAATLTAAGGGRRLMTVILEPVVRSSARS